jgi:hypothetical protein
MENQSPTRDITTDLPRAPRPRTKRRKPVRLSCQASLRGPAQIKSVRSVMTRSIGGPVSMRSN